MLRLLGQNWWLFAVQGLVSVLFGLSALFMPGRTLQLLVILFGAYALVDGLLGLVRTFRAATLGIAWWPFLLQGLAGVAAGPTTALWPGLTALALLYCIAGWALWTGVFQMVVGVRCRKEIEGEWRLIVSGALSVVFGLWLFVAPGDGALALVWLIGSYAIVLGIVVIWLGLRLRGVHQRVEQLRGQQPA
jgi:uncharacterized membrane protein HdeD (DUF308 family)